MAQHTIRFHDGARMAWPTYRAMMLSKISPFAAVARSPQGALNAMPRRRARDQQGGLSKEYCDATERFLGDNGLPDEDVEAVMKILNPYREQEPAEDAGPRGTVGVGGPRGTVGAHDKRLAMDQLDQWGQPRRLMVRAMSLGGESSGFARRFPEAAKIRIV